MLKIYLLSLAAAIVPAAVMAHCMAAAPAPYKTAAPAQTLPAPHQSIIRGAQIPLQFRNMTAREAAASALKVNWNASTGWAASSARQKGAFALTAPLDTAIIRTRPEGRLYKDLYRTARSYFVFWGFLLQSADDGLTCDVVEGPDGSIYLNKPFCSGPETGWIKGMRAAGDTVKFTLPQPVFAQPYADPETQQPTDSIEHFYALRYDKRWTLDENGDSVQQYFPQEAPRTVNFIWRNDTLTMADSCMIGLGFANGGWTGYGTEATRAWPNADRPVEAPADAAEARTYAVRYHTILDNLQRTLFVKVLNKDNDVYIQGIEPSVPDAWVKGQLKDGRITLRKQYLGVDTADICHNYFVPVVIDSAYSNQTQAWKQYIKAEAGSIVFNYDAASGAFESDSAYVDLIGSGSPVEGGYQSLFNQPRYTVYNRRPVTPQNPRFTAFTDYNQSYHMGMVSFLLPSESTGGEVIDPADLYYNVYFDDRLFTFYPDEYKSLADEMTDVPWTFSNGSEFTVDGAEHTIVLYTAGLDKIGVQQFCRVDGEVRSSDLVWLDINTWNGIQTVAPDDSRTAAGACYDLSGRRISAPARGLYLQTVRTADGHLRTVKIVK